MKKGDLVRFKKLKDACTGLVTKTKVAKGELAVLVHLGSIERAMWVLSSDLEVVRQ